MALATCRQYREVLCHLRNDRWSKIGVLIIVTEDGFEEVPETLPS